MISKRELSPSRPRLRWVRSAWMGVLASFWAAAAVAQPPAAVGAVTKIGVFDSQRVSSGTSAGVALEARLTALQQEKRQAVDALAQTLQAKQQEFMSTASSLSPAKQKQMNFEIQRLQNELEAAQKSASQELRLEVQEAAAEWDRLLRSAVIRFGKKNGFAIIMPVDLLGYHSGAIDITDELVKMLEAGDDAG